MELHLGGDIWEGGREEREGVREGGRGEGGVREGGRGEGVRKGGRKGGREGERVVVSYGEKEGGIGRGGYLCILYTGCILYL